MRTMLGDGPAAAGYPERMPARLARLGPPPAGGDPIAVLRWVRRAEIVAGIASLAIAIVVWDTAWLRWSLLGLALLSLSPWPGAAAIIRRSERSGRPPTTLDPERRRARARRAAVATMAYVLIVAFTIATVVDGPGAGVVVAIIALVCSLPGVLLTIHWTRAR
jgi:hypothetical protein